MVGGPKETKGSETIKFHGVCKPQYDSTGLDEDNTFSKFSPSVELSITITNQSLWEKFTVGDKFYLDFTPVKEC